MRTKEDAMKTLYVSDLDGTLLRRDQHTSEFTVRTVNELIEKGMIFSYATARSFITARKAAGFTAHFPVITYNGSMTVDNADGRLITSNPLDTGVYALLDELREAGVYPIVYAFKDGRERFSFIRDRCSQEAGEFIDTRTDDRICPCFTEDELYAGEIFYINCIGWEDILPSFYERYKDKYRCLLQRDIYSDALMFEVMPKGVSKSSAIKRLKEMLGCDRVVVFGDGLNDLDMFRSADESYAVGNAHPDLKKYATAVIGSNESDGVARWLLENAEISR